VSPAQLKYFVLKKLKQADQEFKASLGYIVRPCQKKAKRYFEREHSFITFVIAYCFNCSILLLVITLHIFLV
jgi:hypothetical protein